MDSSNSRRSSTNFLQYIIEEGSLEYSADWSTFSFKSELLARKCIIKDNIEAFHLYAQDSTGPGKVEGVSKRLEKSKDVINELLKNNEDAISKYALISTNNQVLENIKNLTGRNKALESDIKELVEEESILQEEYRQLKLALQKGTEMYEHFGIKVKTRSISNTAYEASLQFEQKMDTPPVIFIVDRIKRKVIDFSMNDALLPNEEEDIIKKFGNLEDLPGLLRCLRDIIIGN